MNILFTNIGRRVSLVNHFRNVYNKLNIKGKIVGTDMNMTAPAIHVVDKKYRICSILHPDYIPTLISICEKEDIKLLISLLDTDLSKLSNHRKMFKEIGTEILISSYKVVDTCQDKIKTFKFLMHNGIETPNLFKVEEALSGKIKDFPLILKPSQGSASKGIFKINNVEELKFYRPKVRNPVLQEFINGTEYTIDVLADFNSNVRCIVPRKRLEVREGEVSKGITVKNQKIIDIAKKCVESLIEVIGPITVQGFLTIEGNFKVTEINPRFGGGHPLAIAAGADFPRWIIEMTQGKDPSIELDGWEDGLLMLRYDDAIFINKKKIDRKK